MINSITLEVRAGKDLEHITEREGKTVFAEVFGLHEVYIAPTEEGEEASKKTIPIYVKFGSKTAAFAVKTIKTGTRFVVDGQLDYYKDDKTNREWFSIKAEGFLPAGSKPQE